MTPEEQFVRQSVAFARTLPFSEAVTYLRGMLSLSGDHELIRTIRDTYTHLYHCDTQLELIASGQMQLPINQDMRVVEAQAKRPKAP
jgi:hypothetical protein